jgi:hypothetical protein
MIKAFLGHSSPRSKKAELEISNEKENLYSQIQQDLDCWQRNIFSFWFVQIDKK